MMTPAEADERIIEGYHVLLSDDLRLAHAAVIEYANEHNDDRWPMGRDVIRFARFYGVALGALGGLVGLLPYPVGRRTIWVDALRDPELKRLIGMGGFDRDTLVSFGIFCAAADTLARERATVH
jgi:hypothetical protein